MFKRLLSIFGAVLIGLIVLLLFYNARGASPDRVWLRAPGWSRALVVGETPNDQTQAAPIAVDPAGNVYLFLTQVRSTDLQPHIVALDPRAAPRWEVTLQGDYLSVADMQAFWVDQALALFWLNDGELYTAQLDAAGTVVQAPTPLADALQVASYSVAATPAGVLIWAAGTAATPGLYLLYGADPAPQQIASIGERPQLRADAGGALHAIWLERADAGSTADVRYAPLAADGTPQAPPQTLAEVANLDRTADVSGPWFGVDATHGYVGWHTRITGGMRAGQTFTLQTAFPLGQPAQASAVQSLFVPEYAATSGSSGPRTPWDGAPAGAASPPAQMVADPAPAGELAVVGTGTVGVGSGQRLPQVAVMYFAGGAPTGVQHLSLSERSAFNPTLISDTAGNLYVSWRELRANATVVFFAATAPETVAALSAVNLDDLLRLASTVVFGMFTGVIFAPFTAVLWIGPALLLLLPHFLLQRFGVRTGRWGEFVSVLLALSGFWVAKVLVIGPALMSVPFAAWLPPLASGPALALQIMTPIMITAAALSGAWAASYGRGVRSPLVAVLVYGAIDTLATMAVYGAGLFGR